jgi:hypothetical protein
MNSTLTLFGRSTDAHYGNGKDKKGQSQLLQAKKAFALACIEQLIPSLSEESLPMVFKACFPYVYTSFDLY